ncbi:MAG TPA: ABC transporter permease [Nocardioidaceae bacterium]|nr:ABC transporter permease [Nocardioidaceae bacterium]
MSQVADPSTVDARGGATGKPRRQLDSTHLVWIAFVVVTVVGVALTAFAGKNFFSSGNLAAVLTLTSTLGFVAIGQTLVILGGSLDLSVPYVISLSSLVAGGIMAGQASGVLPGVLAALAVCALIGLVNGLIVTRLHVHGFIATLGVGLIVSGYLASNYQGSSGSAPRAFQLVGITLVGPVPVSTLVMLGCAGLGVLALRRTRLGHQLYAVGGGREVARMSGVRTDPPLVLAHVLCSVLAGMAGLLLLSRTGVGSPTIGGQGSYDLMSIAAVVLGGTLLAGGRGSIVGTLGGVALFAVLDNVMSVMEINSFLRDVVRGTVIVVAVAVYARRAIPRRPTRFSAHEPAREAS